MKIELSKIPFRSSGSFFAIGIILIVLVMAPQIYGQTQKNKCISWLGLSRNEGCRVAERLKLYVEYHRSQRWDLVESFIANESFSLGYSSEGKKVLIDSMKQIQVLSFSQPFAHGSTEDYSRPLSKQGFYICGEVEFKKEDGEIITSKAYVKPYYRKGKWVFSPLYITYLIKFNSPCGS